MPQSPSRRHPQLKPFSPYRKAFPGSYLNLPSALIMQLETCSSPYTLKSLTMNLATCFLNLPLNLVPVLNLASRSSLLA